MTISLRHSIDFPDTSFSPRELHLFSLTFNTRKNNTISTILLLRKLQTSHYHIYVMLYPYIGVWYIASYTVKMCQQWPQQGIIDHVVYVVFPSRDRHSLNLKTLLTGSKLTTAEICNMTTERNEQVKLTSSVNSGMSYGEISLPSSSLTKWSANSVCWSKLLITIRL